MNRSGKKTTLLFDMDGTLMDTEYPYCRALQQACTAYGETMSETTYFEKYAGATVEDNRRCLIEAVGDENKAMKIIQQSDQNYQTIVETEGVPLKPTATETLGQLQSLGYRLVIASSSTRPVVDQMLELTGLSRYFSLRITGDLVTHSKPHPEIFLRALEEAKVSANEAVVIEDSLQGVESGWRAGIDTIMIPDRLEPTEEVKQMAMAVVPTLKDIIPLIHK